MRVINNIIEFFRVRKKDDLDNLAIAFECLLASIRMEKGCENWSNPNLEFTADKIRMSRMLNAGFTRFYRSLKNKEPELDEFTFYKSILIKWLAFTNGDILIAYVYAIKSYLNQKFLKREELINVLTSSIIQFKGTFPNGQLISISNDISIQPDTELDMFFIDLERTYNNDFSLIISIIAKEFEAEPPLKIPKTLAKVLDKGLFDPSEFIYTEIKREIKDFLINDV